LPKKIKEIVIPREKAVFWLDKNGCWHNENGRFEHKKIIRYFHSCIKRDRHGYYLSQGNEHYTEKVYFPYEDQALFVFDVILREDVTLVLNTGRQVRLKPRKLFTDNDCLYMQLDGEIIKFAEQGLFAIAQLIEETDNRLYIRVNHRRYRIPAKDESADREECKRNAGEKKSTLNGPGKTPGKPGGRLDARRAEY
jgi:hypothetical protein